MGRVEGGNAESGVGVGEAYVADWPERAFCITHFHCEVAWKFSLKAARKQKPIGCSTGFNLL